MDLQLFVNEGVELVIDTKTGETFATIRGYARMGNKPQSTIQSRINRLNEGERNQLVKSGEVYTAGGLQSVRLLTEDLISDWLPNDNPKIASQLLKFGVRGFIHILAGYDVKSTVIEPEPQPQFDLPKTYLDALKALVASEEEKLVLQEQLDEQAPLVAFAEDIIGADNNITVADFARSINIGRNTFYSDLRNMNIFQIEKPTLPYGNFIKSGYFKVTQKVTKHASGDRTDPVTLITPKGQIWLHKKYEDYKKLDQAKNAAEMATFK